MRLNKTASLVALNVVFLVSGVTALVYQAVWLRMFALVLGNSLHSAATVFAAFMGGMALGAWWFGRHARRWNDRLLLYILLEAGVAVSALAVSRLIPHLHSIAAPVWHMLSGTPAAVDIFRVVLALLVMLVPTALIGGTLPVLAAYATERVELSGRRIGAFYGWNTLGAVVGSALTGFWLLRVVGVSLSVYFALALNLLVVLLAVFLRLAGSAGQAAPDVMEHREENSSWRDLPGYKRLLLATAFSTGLAALALEVIWARLLCYILHNDIYAYYLMLSTMLFGIGTGSLVYSLWLQRIRDRLLLVAALVVLLALAAPSCYLACSGFSLRDNILVFNTAFLEVLGNAGAGPFLARIILRLFYALIAMLLPTLLLGAIFPAICAAYISDPTDIGGQTGRVYAANTGGAITGSLLAGFWLVPGIGVQGSLALISTLVLVTGFFLLFRYRSTGPSTTVRKGVAAAVSLAFGLLLIVPSNQIRRFAMQDRPYTAAVFYREGLSGTVAMLEDRINGMRSLYINSIGEVENSFTGMQTFKILGHLPLLLHEGEVKDVLMVTFGGGIASGAVAVHPIERMDVVELEPAMVEAASTAYKEENHNVISDPRVKVHLEDGRFYLSVTRDSYDIVISDATNPASIDSWLLYTREFYSLCASRLNAGGVMAQWLPVHSGSPENYSTVVRTFQSVFPNVSIWQTKDYTVLAGTPGPLAIDYPQLVARLGEKALAEDLAPWCLDQPLELLDCFLMGSEAASQLSASAPVSTDDLPFYQFMPENKAAMSVLAMLDRFREPVEPYLTGLDSLHAAALADSMRPYWRAESFLLRRDFRSAARMNPSSCKYARYNQDYLADGSYYERLRSYMGKNYRVMLRVGIGLAEHGRLNEARDLFSKMIERYPDDPSILSTMGNIEFKLEDYRNAVRYYRAANRLGRQTTDMTINLGLSLFAEGLVDEGMEVLQQAVEQDTASADAHFYLGLGYGQLGRHQDETHQYEQALDKDPEHMQALQNLGARYLEQRRFEPAGEMYSRALNLDPAQPDAWRGLGASLYLNGDVEQATQAFQMALHYDPNDSRARRYLELIARQK